MPLQSFLKAKKCAQAFTFKEHMHALLSMSDSKTQIMKMMPDIPTFKGCSVAVYSVAGFSEKHLAT
jgi:hypothetical protein